MTAADPRPAPHRLAVRGTLFDLSADPGDASESPHARFIEDALVVIVDGRIEQAGVAAALLPTLAPGTPLADHRGKWLVPGFVDTHVHYAQTDVIASASPGLLDWLDRHTFPAERRFEDADHARSVAGFFVRELLANGTTTALVFATVHPGSADAIFEAAAARSMRLVAGKVMMDRHAPDFLVDTPESGYEQSAALIERWHGRGRLGYAITPRFAGSSSEAQLAFAGRLAREYPLVAVQSHVAENVDEVRWIAELFPGARSYLDVYDRFDLLRPGAVYAHCIHLDDADRARMAASGTAAAHCPTSNLFLGSGLFDHRRMRDAGVAVSLATDVGGGTSFSMLRTMQAAHYVAQLGGRRLSPLRAFYFATLGGAETLRMADRIGSFAPGKEADFIVLDPAATALSARRFALARTLEERLFVLMMLGDERHVAATYVLGEPVALA